MKILAVRIECYFIGTAMPETRKIACIMRLILGLGFSLAILNIWISFLIFHSRPLMAILNFAMASALLVFVIWFMVDRKN